MPVCLLCFAYLALFRIRRMSVLGKIGRVPAIVDRPTFLDKEGYASAGVQYALRKMVFGGPTTTLLQRSLNQADDYHVSNDIVFFLRQAIKFDLAAVVNLQPAVQYAFDVLASADVLYPLTDLSANRTFLANPYPHSYPYSAMATTAALQAATDLRGAKQKKPQATPPAGDIIAASMRSAAGGGVDDQNSLAHDVPQSHERGSVLQPPSQPQRSPGFEYQTAASMLRARLGKPPTTDTRMRPPKENRLRTAGSTARPLKQGKATSETLMRKANIQELHYRLIETVVELVTSMIRQVRHFATVFAWRSIPPLQGNTRVPCNRK
jgi:hypothetical protein